MLKLKPEDLKELASYLVNKGLVYEGITLGILSPHDGVSLESRFNQPVLFMHEAEKRTQFSRRYYLPLGNPADKKYFIPLLADGERMINNYRDKGPAPFLHQNLGQIREDDLIITLDHLEALRLSVGTNKVIGINDAGLKENGLHELLRLASPANAIFCLNPTSFFVRPSIYENLLHDGTPGIVKEIFDLQTFLDANPHNRQRTNIRIYLSGGIMPASSSDYYKKAREIGVKAVDLDYFLKMFPNFNRDFHLSTMSPFADVLRDQHELMSLPSANQDSLIALRNRSSKLMNKIQDHRKFYKF